MSNKFKIKIFDIFMYNIMLFPIITILTDSGIMTKIIFGILLVSYILMILKKKIKKNSLAIIILLIASFSFSIINSNFPLINNNMLFYFPFLIIYMLFTSDYKQQFIEWFTNKEKLVRLTIKIWTFIVGISIFIPSCYYVKEGGEKYFGSFVQSIFRLGPTCVLIMSLVLISMTLYKRKKDIIYFAVPLYSCLMGSSRTYLIIAIFILLIAIYIYISNKRKFFLILIPLTFIGCLIMMNTSIYQKILFTLDDNQYGDFWFRITSGRSGFWMQDLSAWSKVSIFKKIFGAGLNFTYEVSNLWGHNDFIELLCGNGIVGVMIYLIIMIKSIYSIKKNRSSNILIFLIFFVWFFNAFFNMHYTYFCCVLGFPFILIAIEIYTIQLNNEKL